MAAEQEPYFWQEHAAEYRRMSTQSLHEEVKAITSTDHPYTARERAAVIVLNERVGDFLA